MGLSDYGDWVLAGAG